jgi:hypothetical protein
MGASQLTLGSLFITLLAGCQATGASSSGQPSPKAPAEADWRSARAADLPGYWESEAIDGEAAKVVGKVYTWLAADGHYTSSALIMGNALATGQRPEFRAITGEWRLDAGILRLADEREAIQAEVAGDRLRLTSSNGVVTLRRRGE